MIPKPSRLLKHPIRNLMLNLNPEEPSALDARQQNAAAVEALGSKSQQEAAHRSAMLKEPIRKLAARGEDGGEVANALVNLKLKVEELDPGQFSKPAVDLVKAGSSTLRPAGFPALWVFCQGSAHL